MYENLTIIQWPDPRLKKRSEPIERFDERLRLLAGKMLELMHGRKGVGLAAPQVGLNVRLFVIDGNPIDQVETGYLARIWQHETDHLNGTLLTDRMGALAKLTHRKRLKELEEEYLKLHPEAAAKPKKRSAAKLLRK